MSFDKRLRLFVLFLLCAVGAVQVAAQEQMKVSGTVFDDLGDPVVGASVLVQGTTTGASTNLEGKFTIDKVTRGAQLVVSYVGMETMTVAAKPTMKITLKSADHQIEDVLVVAFGQQKRSAFTGSAAVVDAKTIEQRQVTNALEALNGQVAGLQMINNSGSPSSTPKLLVRGISSINSGTEPLIVVDGSPYTGGWNNINPADIESITVLKDASSNALYGARGANGVIMITTKQAQRGEAKISLDAKWGVSSRGSHLYETIDDPVQYYETHYRALYNYFANSKGQDLYSAHVNANNALSETASTGGLAYVDYTAPKGEYLIGENGRMNPNAVLGNRVYNNGNYYTLMPDDWTDAAFRTGLRQEYNVNINGGNEAAQFYASLGYLNATGIVRHSDYERYTARMKAAYQARKWLKVGGNINYAHSESNLVDNDDSSNLFSTLVTMAPIYPLYLRDGNGNVLRDDNGLMYDYGDGVVNGLVRPVQTQNNPVQTNVLDTDNSNSNSWSINGFADITPMEGLKITVNGSATDREYRTVGSTAPFYGYGAATYPGGYTSVSQYRYLSFNFQQLVNYSMSFGNHNVSMLLGHENYKQQSQNVGGSKKDMANYWENKELAGAITTVGTSSSTVVYNTEGFFFRGMYDYAEKYFANVSYRRDASSNFHPDYRWGNFYSLGAAWILTKEKWMEPVKWVNMLKLKGSFGQQGNDAIGSFRYTDTYDISNVAGEIGLTFKSKGTKDITWETNSNINVGVEFELLKSRLTGGVEYFYRKTTDMLSFVNDPISSGYTGHYANIGDMVNKGIEVELRGYPVRTRDLTWELNMNLTHYKNEVTRLSKDDKSSKFNGHWGQQSGSYFIGEGFPRYTWLMPKYMGVNDKGQALYYNSKEEGGVTTNNSSVEYVQCGDPTPDIYGGFGTSLSWKGFDLSVSMTYSVGGKVMDAGYFQLMQLPVEGTTGMALHKDVLKGWSYDNPASSIPRLQFNDINSNGMDSRYLTDGSYLSLQNVNIGYTFPKSLIRPLQLSNLRVYVSAENLWFTSARKGLDPRSTSTFDGYCSIAHYSITRTITGGLTVNF